MEHLGFDEPDINITGDLVEQQLRLWNARRLAALEKPDSKQQAFRFVTLARDKGCLGKEIAADLSRRLGWHVFDKEIVTYIAENSHVHESLVNELDQKAQGLIQDAVGRILRMPEYASFGKEEYHRGLLKTLVYLATQGSAILVGRGANFALKGNSQGVKVRIIASREARLQRLMQKWKITMKEAQRRMQNDDEERRKFIRQCYGREFDDMHSYDIVFNTDGVSAQRVVSSILAFMSLQEQAAGEGKTLKARTQTA